MSEWIGVADDDDNVVLVLVSYDIEMPEPPQTVPFRPPLRVVHIPQKRLEEKL